MIAGDSGVAKMENMLARIRAGNASLPDAEFEMARIYRAAADGMIDPPGNRAFDLVIEACVVSPASDLIRTSIHHECDFL
jgi:hypothetical protein